MNFSPDHPVSLRIAADARLAMVDYVNDQIWEINLGISEPPSISLQTTFGLRAKVCRIFPRFILNGQVVNNPAEFSRPVTIHRYHPNYISLSCKPFSTINVNLEYWVPGSHVVACRSIITNTGHEKCQFQLEWAELLIPFTIGDRMSSNEINFSTVLTGNASDLYPVLYLKGGVTPGRSPYPSLNLSLEISPHQVQDSRWVHASLSDTQKSFDLAKEIINQNWEAEFAKIERVYSSDIQIKTGNPEWDQAFHFSQVLSNQLFLSPTEYLGSSSFVLSRKPDQGYSLLKDGNDYEQHWNGQTALDTYHLTNFLLPGSPDRLKGIIDNFFITQLPSGEIDWKPGLGGQKSRLLSTPLLAKLCLELFEYDHSIPYLQNAYPILLRYFFSWFTDIHDRDQDGIPEWDQAVQSGYIENPNFSYEHPWSLGIEISSVESPDLISYLYAECRALISMAKQLEDFTTQATLETTADILRNSVIRSWSDQLASYQYLDRDTHATSPLYLLGKLRGEGIISINQDYAQPVRPFFHILTKKEGTLPIQVYIHGINAVDIHRVDRVPTNNIRWHQGVGFMTSDIAYKHIEKIQINGLSEDVEIAVMVGTQKFIDQTMLIPLWAGIPSNDQAKVLINLTIMNKKKFLGAYGIKACFDITEAGNNHEDFLSVHPVFQNYILDGLLQYGENNKAAELFTRTMKAVSKSMSFDFTLHQNYQSETGKPIGGTNTLASLVPIKLFLKIIGIKIINSSMVEITGKNPFQWPVTIRYRGLTVVQQDKKTLIIFPDGQSVTVENDKAQLISQQ